MAISADERSEARPDVSTNTDNLAAPAVAERFWNLPNTITMLRIAIVPVLLLVPFSLSVV